MSAQYEVTIPPATKECNFCHKPFIVGHSDTLKFVLLTEKLENHFTVSKECYEQFKAAQEKKIESLPAIKLGAKYQHVKVDELLKIVKSLDDATTVNNMAVLKRLNEIDEKLTGIEKMIEGLMP
ncbi:MAG: hypothetical protein CV087_23300 [Candidatus Brocadia sp. WS118]|nr:MAG: hypothetical protein CV087_23300 [Candidatus Brocadia sp. WS118]